MTIQEFKNMKENNIKISMLTCYDYWSANIIATTNIDSILVGDSLSMIMHGAKSTISATVELMEIHTAAVSKGAPNKMIITDLPFLSYRKDRKTSMNAVDRVIRAGANAVKIEGVFGNENLIEHIVSSGIPVMGHIGLIPQAINQMGGYKVQGRTKNDAQVLLEQSILLEKVGCFAIVLECIPNDVAKKITESISIPTIGIGAGPYVSGQVLVLHDLLGLLEGLSTKLRFVKKYMEGTKLIKKSIDDYVDEVKKQSFPDLKHCFGVK